MNPIVCILVILLTVACVTEATQQITPTPTATPLPTQAPTVLPTMPPSGPTVSVGDARFVVDVAATAPERARGLSGRPGLPPGAGMLFVFEEPGSYTFWMNEMQFPLDFVWIGADCLVAALTEDVPHPEPGQDPADLPRYRPAGPVQYVLEINAGEIAASGIHTGDRVAFGGEMAGEYGC